MKPDRLSRTAAYIAIKFYGLTREQRYRKLFDDQTLLFYERVVAELPPQLNTYHSLLKKRWFNRLCRLIDELLLPGDLMHILSRKFYVANMIDRLVEMGYDQLVVLGAGFDHLGVTYSTQSISCIEIDAPNMAHFKQEFIRDYHYKNDYLTIHPFHFSFNSASKLFNGIRKLDPQKKTIIVAEGFFDYLTPPEADKVLENITTYWKDDVTLISTVFSLQELSPLRSFIFETGVKMVGEELKLHYSSSRFSDMLQRHKFSIEKNISAQFMKESMPLISEIDASVLPGFYILIAQHH